MISCTPAAAVIRHLHELAQELLALPEAVHLSRVDEGAVAKDLKDGLWAERASKLSN